MIEHILTALAEGGGGGPAVRFLVHTQRSKHQLLLRLVVATASKVGDPRAVELAAAYHLLADLQVDYPAVVDQLVRHPPVGAWAIRALGELQSGAVADHGYLTALAASAALLSRAHCAVDVPVRAGRLFLPFLGQANLPGADRIGTVQVRSRPTGSRIVAGTAEVSIPADQGVDGDGWRSIRRLSAQESGVTWGFLLDDLDPYRIPQGHRASRRDAATPGNWQSALQDAWALLVAHHPEAATEIAAAITMIVPLQAPDGRHVSATSRHSFGATATSLPPDGLSFAVALAHERQHLKLNALLDLVALVDDLDRTRWHVPWRADPRPVAALLHGAYAHLGVANFWRRQNCVSSGHAALRARTEFVRWRDEIQGIAAALRTSGALTDAGSRFVDGMAATLKRWREEPAPVAGIEKRSQGWGLDV